MKSTAESTRSSHALAGRPGGQWNEPPAAMQALEDRRMFDIGPLFLESSVTLVGEILVINGGEHADTASVDVDSSVPGKLTVKLSHVEWVEVEELNLWIPVEFTDVEQQFDTPITQINFFGHEGDDKFSNLSSVKSVAQGNWGDDSLVGGSGGDKLSGGSGHDTLRGRGGSDTLYGDSGNDFLDGDSGNDLLYGDIGNDTLYGDIGNDYLYGDIGNDCLYGDSGQDTLFGGSDNDLLDGGYDLYVDYVCGQDGSDIVIPHPYDVFCS